MSKMSHSCEDHGQAIFNPTASMDSWSRTEPPGWMMALIPALAISSTLSDKWEEGIRKQAQRRPDGL